ncbi:MazG-like family protein [Catellatospora sp. NPDC049609]|uniref:MazG-like family protein n=1 Tax=Catellatospora sp. NPDC049609 TaxID=3155505 RepID=UPI00341A4074
MDEVTWRAVGAAVRWLDAHHGSGAQQQTMRILKVTEEAGEAARAWIGVQGQNPRKGVTHSSREVADELADVVLSALVAIQSLGFDPAEVLSGCAGKVLTRMEAHERRGG